MMGERTVMQEALFYSFRIEGHVQGDHLLRAIDQFVDLSGSHEHLKPFYSIMGQPSIDPELMIRMLVTPKRINPTDPASRWTAATRGSAFYAYSTNDLIELDHAVVVDVEATTAIR